MNGGEIAQIILAFATLITAAGGVLIGMRNSQKIREVHSLTNSLAQRNEALAQSTGNAEGNLQGRAEQTAERKAAGKPP